jgi:hypothetical protein
MAPRLRSPFRLCQQTPAVKLANARFEPIHHGKRFRFVKHRAGTRGYQNTVKAKVRVRPFWSSERTVGHSEKGTSAGVGRTDSGGRYVLISVVFHARGQAPLRMKMIVDSGTLPPQRNC